MRVGIELLTQIPSYNEQNSYRKLDNWNTWEFPLPHVLVHIYLFAECRYMQNAEYRLVIGCCSPFFSILHYGVHDVCQVPRFVAYLLERVMGNNIIQRKRTNLQQPCCKAVKYPIVMCIKSTGPIFTMQSVIFLIYIKVLTICIQEKHVGLRRLERYLSVKQRWFFVFD